MIIEVLFFAVLLFVLLMSSNTQIRRSPAARMILGAAAWDYEYWLAANGVSEKEIDICMEWALGPGWMRLSCCMTDDAWNERHSDIFIMHGSDNVVEGWRKIALAYLNKERSQ